MSTEAHARFRAWAAALLSHHHEARQVPAGSETYQTSTMAALLDGIYDGDVTISELLSHGDFGLGTFNHLDGEMVVLDGACHHLRADGSASVAAGDDRTPFAAVTWFRPEVTIQVSAPMSRDDVISVIDEATKTANLIHAIRIDGSFSQVRTRTVMAQSPPYPPLTQATANEPVTDFGHTAGTMAGFRTPDYEQGISVAGYHLHFINQPRTRGGHCLDYQIEHAEIRVSTSSELHLSLPRNEAFLKADMSPQNVAQQIRQTEGSEGAT
jgi:acetolactate decarboxylase